MKLLYELKIDCTVHMSVACFWTKTVWMRVIKRVSGTPSSQNVFGEAESVPETRQGGGYGHIQPWWPSSQNTVGQLFSKNRWISHFNPIFRWSRLFWTNLPVREDPRDCFWPQDLSLTCSEPPECSETRNICENNISKWTTWNTLGMMGAQGKCVNHEVLGHIYNR